MLSKFIIIAIPRGQNSRSVLRAINTAAVSLQLVGFKIHVPLDSFTRIIGSFTLSKGSSNAPQPVSAASFVIDNLPGYFYLTLICPSIWRRSQLPFSFNSEISYGEKHLQFMSLGNSVRLELMQSPSF
ncbi:MAG: hypothetical protein EZS28_040123 [Streblomastix strix]|uniref:Uncharacterized protein n=1 Tax=Streblomastix strix TaxID=222440 RepID=A0A5J4U1V8_9EUKA|nr:MAG: hypothetical protein EZS28_040123 [Streblomastix strix]